MKRTPILLLALVNLAGCQITPKKTPEQFKSDLAMMDDYDICFELGKASLNDFESWKLAYNEKYARESIRGTWTLSDTACNEAQSFAKSKIKERKARKRRTARRMGDAIGDAFKAYGNRVKNTPQVYTPTRTDNNVSCYGTSILINCYSY